MPDKSHIAELTKKANAIREMRVHGVDSAIRLYPKLEDYIIDNQRKDRARERSAHKWFSKFGKLKKVFSQKLGFI